jgi:hypothetical protein
VTTPTPVAGEDARSLAAELKRRWRLGQEPDAAAAVADHPDLARCKSLVVDLAYEEIESFLSVRQ